MYLNRKKKEKKKIYLRYAEIYGNIAPVFKTIKKR